MRSINVTQTMRDSIYSAERDAIRKSIKQAFSPIVDNLLSDLIDTTVVQNLLKCRFVRQNSYLELTKISNFDDELGHLSVILDDAEPFDNKLQGIIALPRADNPMFISGQYTKNRYELRLNNYGTAKIISYEMKHPTIDYITQLQTVNAAVAPRVAALKEFYKTCRKFTYTRALLKEYPEYESIVTTLYSARFEKADKRASVYADNRKSAIKQSAQEKAQLIRKEELEKKILESDVKVEASAKEVAVAVAKATLLTV